MQKQRLLDIWHGLEHWTECSLDSAIDEWRTRLHACIRAKGGYFEQLLWQYANWM